MTVEQQANSIFVVAILLWFTVPAWLVINKRFLSAGFIGVFAAIMPLLWQGWFTDSEAKGFHLLAILLLPGALLAVAIGVLVWLYRIGRYIWQCTRLCL
ncbi:hypothetical protein [Sphingomonas sp.]|uniref:hypothetical protein n=1 Tax=Sphingomonas sp. TaxID=28214 RepID=UPI002DEEF2EC|nr:hypothetical protein [Sphingomonas sp.]